LLATLAAESLSELHRRAASIAEHDFLLTPPEAAPTAPTYFSTIIPRNNTQTAGKSSVESVVDQSRSKRKGHPATGRPFLFKGE
jgi:hypothetical protein